MPMYRNQESTKLPLSYLLIRESISSPFSSNSPKDLCLSSMYSTWKSTCLSSITTYKSSIQTKSTSSHLPRTSEAIPNNLMKMSYKKELCSFWTTGATPWNNSLLLNFQNSWKMKNAYLRKPKRFLTMLRRNSLKYFKTKFREF